MAVLTKDKIFITTEQIIKKKGIEKTTLSDVAKDLGVTHAALYKHYKNKEDLLQQLALRWLKNTSHELMVWEPRLGISVKQALHEWLWLLANTKKRLYKNDKRMFRLYTDYLETNLELVNKHLRDLAKKIEEISKMKKIGSPIIKAFTYFHNPYFAERWENEDYEKEFEELWILVADTIIN